MVLRTICIVSILITGIAMTAGGLASPVWAMEPSQDMPPIFEGLGSHGREITTSSATAQRYFNQGLCFLYAFNRTRMQFKSHYYRRVLIAVWRFDT